MHSDTFEQLLDGAAALCGIGPGFWDIWGRYHQTTREAKQAILRAKGFDARDAASLERSLAEHTRREWGRLIPHSIVTGESDRVHVPVSVPAEWTGEFVRFRVLAEDGTAADIQLRLSDLPADGSIAMDGGTRVRKQATLDVKLPLGYHEVSATVAGET